MCRELTLRALYGEWKELTHREGTAIRASDWEAVRDCQKAKSDLQLAILRETESAGSLRESSGAGEESESLLRGLIDELIHLERENQEWISRRLESARNEKAQLQGTARTLRRMHQTYVPAAGAVWSGYS